jgi:hypothetical protein
MDCVKVDNDRFFEYSHYIRVEFCKSCFGSDIKVRECSILSIEDWNEFSAECFLPWYKQGITPSDSRAENYSLREYALKYPCSLDPNQEMRILSAYHSSLGLRLLVDGCHRAVALQSEVNKGKNIPPVTVIECYGTQMERVFPCDFDSLLKTYKRQFPTKVDSNEKPKKPTAT